VTEGSVVRFRVGVADETFDAMGIPHRDLVAGRSELTDPRLSFGSPDGVVFYEINDDVGVEVNDH
jgi:hypothetical protein